MKRNEVPAQPSPNQVTSIADDRQVIPAAGEDITPAEHEQDVEMMHRIEHLPRDVGWLLIWVGVLGVVLPGIVGVPLIVAGAAVVVPGGRKWLARWAGRLPPKFVHPSMRQIGRMLDQMDSRYPPLKKSGPERTAQSLQKKGIDR
jgi:hypothetical protein